MNPSGDIAFWSTISGTSIDASNDRGTYRYKSGSLEVIVREGDQAPGTSSGIVFGHLPQVPVINASGAVGFPALLAEPYQDPSISALYIYDSGSLNKVVATGDQAPNDAVGVEFSGFDGVLVEFNASGQFAFLSRVLGPGVNSDNQSRLYKSTPTGLTEIAREGNQAPGASPDVVYRNFGAPVINDSEQLAFSSTLRGVSVDDTNDRGIYLENAGSVVEIAREGNQAPGASPGELFTSFDSLLLLNAFGQVAFLAEVDGTAEGIYATDVNGVLNEIVREGSLFDVDDDPTIDDLRTIERVLMVTGSGGEEGRPSAFNDLGQIVFFARFTDGTEGIFVSNTVAIPEPASILLLGLVGLLMVRRH